MIFNVILSPNARYAMDIYFECYQGTQNNNDMIKRAFNYSRIIKCLANFDEHIDDWYMSDGKNCLDINSSERAVINSDGQRPSKLE